MEIHQGKHHQACVFRDPGVARALLGGAVAAPATAPGTVPLLLPHEHVIKGVEGAQAKMLSRVRLFVFAICLHNLPEGVALGSLPESHRKGHEHSPPAG